jgi:hypothetical protein
MCALMTATATTESTATPASRQRMARRKRAKAVATKPDMRTRLGRLGEKLEREYTSLMKTRGVEIDPFVEIEIENLACAMAHVKLGRAAHSRGLDVDLELLRGWIIRARSCAKALRLKPSFVDEPAASPPAMKPMRSILQEAGKLP